MQLEPQVTFKNVNPSDAILDHIHAHLARLERIYPAIRSCRVVFERPRHGRRGEDRFRLDLVLTLAGGVEVAVSRDPPEMGCDDTAKAVGDTFEIIERRVERRVNGARPAARLRPSAVAAPNRA